jgi:hypothetical protein
MNLAWRFGDFVSPKQHRPDLARYPIIGRWVPIAHGFRGSEVREASETITAVGAQAQANSPDEQHSKGNGSKASCLLEDWQN